ncbi:renalase isoform X2 [Corythoichthys intestinalis]|uniref:renalase isoform X2 n=1 Tax=Corythoichthys intestinalis TaxID=161448 RepID=UPI0025A4EE26|nr:renalase isoform X2 [Corythoichthys intestinalis]XP_061807859.1 renalase-like [Nerophis lumbriciformis]
MATSRAPDACRVLVVGAGLTGSLCACLLRRTFRDKVDLVVWDKARGTGGRMSTYRPPDPSYQPVDLGAQYVTATREYARAHHSFYSELLAAGVLRPLDCAVEGLRAKEGAVDYVAPLGMGAVVKHFLKQSGARVFLEHHLSGVYRRGASWEVRRKEGGDGQSFDALLLTIPVPQILQLQGDLKDVLSDRQKQLLQGVSYSSRFALALFFAPGTDLGVPWAVRYFNNYNEDDGGGGEPRIVCYAAVEPRKRAAEEEAGRGPALVVHTGAPFGLRHLESDAEAVRPVVLRELRRLLPDLPEPVAVKCHKWRYSQVASAADGCPGHMVLSDRPPLVLAGDAFTHSNFDGCVASALSALAALGNLV